jgi:uncharacterized membrane protein (UPF0127 family)
MRIQIGNKEFEVRVSASDEESRTGLSNTESLPKKEGFAMKFDGTVSIPITMQQMLFPLDIIFTLNGKVTKVVTAQPGQEDIIIKQPSDLIIEVNAGEASGILPKDEVKFLGKKNEDGTVEMAEGGIATIGNRQVLDENGQNQMNLKGGERIFSRISTRKIFELAKAKEYMKLGKYVVTEIKKQDERPEEYAAN